MLNDLRGRYGLRTATGVVVAVSISVSFRRRWGGVATEGQQYKVDEGFHFHCNLLDPFDLPPQNLIWENSKSDKEVVGSPMEGF